MGVIRPTEPFWDVRRIWCVDVCGVVVSKSMSMSESELDEMLLVDLRSSDETAVRGRRLTVVAKFPVWNLLLFRRRSPLEDLGSIRRGGLV